MPIMTIGASPAEMQNRNIENLGGGVGNLSGAFPNPGLILEAQLRRAQTAQLQQRALLQQQYQNELAQSFVVSPDGKTTTIDPVHWARANAIRLSMDPNADPVQGMMAVRGQIPETNAKGGAFAALPLPVQQTVVGPQPIKVAPGSKVLFSPGDARNPRNQTPTQAPASGTAPASGGIMGGPSAAAATTAGQPGAGASQQSAGGNPNVYGTGKMLTGKPLEQINEGRAALIKMQQAEQMIQANPGMLNGWQNRAPGWLANLNSTPQEIQLRSNLGNLFSEINQERAGMRGASSPVALKLDEGFLPVQNSMFHADTSTTAMNKLKALESSHRVDYGALTDTLESLGYESPKPLPAPIAGTTNFIPNTPGSFTGVPEGTGTPASSPQPVAPTSTSSASPVGSGIASITAASSLTGDGQPDYTGALNFMMNNPTDPRSKRIQQVLAAKGVIPQPAVPAIPDQAPAVPATPNPDND